MKTFLKRDAYRKLLDWKQNSNGKTALLIEGARRVGKTVLAEEFGKNEYATTVLVDFSTASEEFKQTFLDTRSNLDQFFLYFQAYTGETLIDHNTLVIFDEVQSFPQAREFIKHLVADGRYHYIETGSLISLKQNTQDILIPSEEESIALRPFSFGEFLDALGESSLRNLIAKAKEALAPLPDELHRKAERLFREYMLVGGMPQAVEAYAQERNISQAERAKQNILSLYYKDIAKYGEKESLKINNLFSDLPSQLSRKEKRFKISDVKESARMREYKDAMEWLSEAHLVNICYNCTNPEVGLNMFKAEDSFKCYLLDTGLLASMAFGDEEGAAGKMFSEILQGKIDVNEGMLAENVVAQQLVFAGKPLYFYSSYSKNAEERMEIDFLIRAPYPNAAMKTRVSPVEVKSGKRYKTVSLDKFKDKFSKKIGTEFVFHPNQLRTEGDRVYLPLYMSSLL